MEIKGKFLELLEPKTGESSRGNWKKQDFIIETEDQFPKKVCISNWNDKVDLSALSPGALITAHVNVESREYNGNWYTDIKIWKLESESSSPPPPAADLPGFNESDEAPPWGSEQGESDQDLPF
ncbi:MAG: DUF3127 domain-containing protein [Bacteroidales bacterium]